ncbi:unnamed protein product [Arabidopsis halleri]
MEGRRKKQTKICNKVSHEEDRISQLPEHLISEILFHLSTKDAVRTSVLSTNWRNLWQSVPGLDLEPIEFSNFDAFVSFVERFFDSHRESWIRKLRLNYCSPHGRLDLSSWIDAVTTRRIQHLDVRFFCGNEIPLSLYTCQTLVHLRLSEVTLSSAEFVSLPCLKIMRLLYITYPNETTLQKLISGSPVLEVLTIVRSSNDDDKANVLLVRSHTLKRVYINDGIQVVIDAPLLQCLRATVSSTKNFQILNLGSSARLEFDFPFTFSHATYSSSMIHDILTDISRVRDLVISNDIWKEIVKNQSIRLHEEKREPNVMFSAVPRCLVSSLKFVELKRSIPRYEGEMELVRYFLKNSIILEKLRLNVYYTKKAKCAFLTELVAMPRCSSACEVLVL